MNYYLNLSSRLLEIAKSGEDTQALRKELYYVSTNALAYRLNTDELKVIFWQNIYNAYLLIMIQEQVLPKNIFKRKRIKIARLVLSLNDIEYGILKKPKYKIDIFRVYSSLYYSSSRGFAVKQMAVSEEARLDKNILQLSQSS